MQYQSEQEILELVNGFRNRTLPKSQWTHEAHLTVGIWFHRMHSEYEAITYLRSGIISYNVATGVFNTPETGYHETMTLFWARIIRNFVSTNKKLSLIELCNSFLTSRWASKELPLNYYSKEKLFSVKARATWVAPELKDL